MGLVVTIFVVVFGGIGLAIREIINCTSFRNKKFPFEHDNKIWKYGEPMPKEMEEPVKKPGKLRKFWDDHFMVILVGIYLVAMVLPFHVNSIPVMVLCLLILIAGLVIIILGFLASAGDNLIKRSVNENVPTLEQRQDVAKRFGYSSPYHPEVIKRWREEEYQRRKIV